VTEPELELVTDSCSEPTADGFQTSVEDPKPMPEQQLELPLKQPDQAGNFVQVDS
jgi:hypothetical protein